MHSPRAEHKRQAISGKWILGIDPGKERHTGALLNPSGDPQGRSFSFAVSAHGFRKTLPEALRERMSAAEADQLVVAVETSCNLWLTIAAYLHGQGYTVVLVNPLTTKHARPLRDHDFSRTDPKDARLIAENAQKGCYDPYRTFSPDIDVLHHLSLTRSKILKDKNRTRLRLRAFMEQYFPEFLNAFDLESKTAFHLLRRAFLPRHFLALRPKQEHQELRRISRGTHGADTVQRLQQWARDSIAVPVDAVLEVVLRQTLDGWLDQLELLQQQLTAINEGMVERARRYPAFEILTSIPNIAGRLAACLIAECRGLEPGVHPKQIERYAGLNLRLSESGQYVGHRRISHIGNARLRCILYQMAVQTTQVVPFVRRRYLQRQLKGSGYRKNVVASIAQLLKVICTLINEQRPYEERPAERAMIRRLERKLEPKETPKRKHRRSVHRLGNPTRGKRPSRKAA